MWDSGFLPLLITSSSEHKKTSISYSLHAIFPTSTTTTITTIAQEMKHPHIAIRNNKRPTF